jgi:DNA segregation ATPase FtsK/SpoIIIE-like protein
MSLSEIPNIVTEEITKKMATWLDQMTHYYKNQIEPPRPEFIVWDEKEKRFSFNWEINRSQYKNKILEGTSEKEIIQEVNAKNKKMRSENKISLALEGSEERGTGKYRRAIELIKSGAPDEVIIKKTMVKPEEILLLKNGLLPGGSD